MATIKEDYVSFQIARLLKEKGFQQLQDNCGYFTTEMVYSINVDDNGEHHFAHQYPAGVYNKDEYIAAPTLQMAMKWLREVHKIHIAFYPYGEYSCDNYQFDVYKDNELVVSKDDGYITYEQAVEAAIKYCLENLI